MVKLHWNMPYCVPHFVINMTFLIYTSIMLIWLVPPFTQLKERFFFYFLFVALGDFISFIFYWFFKIHLPMSFFSSFSTLALISIVITRKDFKKYSIIIFLIFIIIFCQHFLFKNNNLDISILVIVHTLILAKFLFEFVMESTNRNNVNIFLLVLLLYEATVISKFLNLLTNFADAYFYFIITSLFEFFIGLFFCIFKEKDIRVVLQPK